MTYIDWDLRWLRHASTPFESPPPARRISKTAIHALVLFVVLMLIVPASEADISPNERSALLALYASTNGPTMWTQTTGWGGPPGTECSWFGIQCQANSAVLVIDLSANNLTGTLPPQINAFTSAQAIRLQGNNLMGQVPPTLGDLTSLLEISLHQNALSGPIPLELGSLSGLLILRLDNNQLNGTIPASLGSLPNLQNLNLVGNLLSGPIPPELGGLPNLQFLRLDGNALTGPIPASLGSIPTLNTLSAAFNSLNGSIPPELGNLTTLQILDLKQNQLSGAIPSSLGGLPSLTVLVVESNSLVGELPPSLANLDGIAFLDLGYNGLYATDPGVLTWADTEDPGWELTQTVAPTNVSVTMGFSDATVSWTQIDYTAGSGTYEVFVDSGSGPLFAAGTINKTTGAVVVYGLQSGVSYDFTVRTISDPNPFNPQNQVISGFSAAAQGTTAVPSISISDASVTEGNAGTTSATFDVTLTPAVVSTVSVDYTTANVSALAGEDYTAVGPVTLTFTGGQTVKQVTVLVTGEAADESDETFIVALNNPSNVIIVDEEGIGTILDDDCTLTASASAPTDGNEGVAVDFTSSTPVNTCTGAVTYNWSFGDGSTSESQNPSHLYVTAGTYSWTLTVGAGGITSGANGTIVIAGPANVVVLSNPKPMLQPADQAGATTQFALTNIGGTSTSVTLARQGDFFTLSPTSFLLDAGAARTVNVTALPRPIDSYSGAVQVSGAGVPNGFAIPIQLVTYGPPGEELPDIIPLQVRVDLSGSGNIVSGSAQFKNIGTSPSTGVVASDANWLIPETDVATIQPGQVITVQFVANRLLLPNPSSLVSSITTLRFVYPPAPPSSARTTSSSGSGSAGLAVSVSFAQPSPKGLPAVPPGQVGLTLGGLSRTATFPTRVVSDIRLTSSFAAALPPLDFYFIDVFKPAIDAASLSQPGQPSGGIALAAPSGVSSGSFSAHLRGGGVSDITVSATMMRINDATRELFQLELPRLRSNRGAGPGDEVALPGLGFVAGNSCRLVIQEVSGAVVKARVSILNAAGATLLERPERSMGAFEAVEEDITIPSGAATIVVENSSITGGKLVAFAMENGTSDGMVLHDPRYDEGAAQGNWIAPFVTGGQESGRKRPTRPASGSSLTAANDDSEALASERTSFALFNPGANEARVRLEFWTTDGIMSAQQETTIAPGATLEYDDVLRTLGVTSSGADQLRVRLLSGSVVPAAIRVGTGITEKAIVASLPVIDMLNATGTSSSIALGPFDDASLESRKGGVPSAFTPTLGLVETSGNSIGIEVAVSYASGRELALGVKGTANFTLGANQTLLIKDVVKTIVGSKRDASGDLHDVTLKLRRVSGSGSFLPFVVSESIATGDAMVIIR